MIFALILFNLIIFIHELGHFFTAKLFGVKINEFAIGMGPKIFKFHRGETLYSIRMFPIGGFCAMEGEDEESDSENSFNKKEPWKRAIIVSMGAIMNILLGFFMTFILLCQQPNLASTRISKFADNSISSQHGLMAGDEIIAVNGYRIYCYNDLAFSIASSENIPSFKIDVKRSGESITLNDVNLKTVTTDDGKESVQIDFYVEPIKRTFIEVIKHTFINTISTVRVVWTSLIGLITGKFSISSMSGPVGIASVVKDATSEGMKVSPIFAINNVVRIMALITINLGVFNLLPLPALDGGRLVFLFAELILGRAISAKYEGWVHATGLFLFIALMIFITYSDIIKLIKR